MSFHERVMRREIERILEGFYRDGRVPGAIELENAINEFLEQYPPGRPRLRLRPQKRRERFNVDGFNSQTSEIWEDLNILYQGLIDIVEAVSRQVSQNRAVVEVYDRQLDRLEDLLEDLVLTTKSASGYLFSVSERFSDLSNIDTGNTDATIDLLNRIATLRKMERGSARVDVSHLLGASSTETGPEPTIAVLEGNVSLRAQTPFSNALSSDGLIWTREYVSTESGPVTIRAEFRLPPTGSPWSRISRLDVKPVSPFDMRVYHTTEDRDTRENYIFFPGFEGNYRITRRSSYRFETRNVTYLRIELTKDTPDQTVELPNGQTGFIYRFEVEELEFYTYGYARESVILTQPLLPEGSDFLTRLGKVSLETKERPFPDGTNIRYFIQQVGENTPFTEIIPVNRTSVPGPKLIDFGGTILSPRRENRFRVSSPTVSETRNAITFYELTTLPFEPVFGSAQMYSGIGAWRLSPTTKDEFRTIKNNYLVFTTNDDKQFLYVTKPRESTPARVVGDRVVLELEHNLLLQDGLPLIPLAGGGVNQNPLYSIEQVLKWQGDGTVSGASGSIIRVPNKRPEVNTNESVSNPDRFVGQFMYVNDGTRSGYFKVRSYKLDGSSNTVFTFDDLGALQGSSVTWRLNIEDVTQNVIDASSREIELENTTLNSGDRFLVTYRRELDADQEIVEGSVEVINTNGETMVPNQDYALTQDKSIQRLSDKINAGAGTTVSATVNFSIRQKISDLVRYVVYVDLDNRTEIQAQSINIDRDFGEAVSIVRVAGSNVSNIEDAASGGLWDMEGTMSIIVTSKDLVRPDGTIDTNSAIYKFINIEDNAGNKILDPGRYFSRMYAEPEPMQQTTLTRLRAATPDNYELFAVGSSNEVITNFDPSDRDDLLVLLPGQTLPQSYMDMEIGFLYRPTEENGGKQVRLRIEFTRKPEVDGSATPVLEGFTLRYS